VALDTGQLYNYNLDGNSTDQISAANGTDTSIVYSAGNGKIIQGAGFNGTSSTILLPNNDWLATTAFSISVWVKTIATNPGQFICRDNVSGAGRIFQLGMLGGGNSGKVNVVRFDGSTNVVTNIVSVVQINDGNWHHVMVTFSTATGTRLYIDNVLDSFDPVTTANRGGTGSAPYLGSLNNVSTYYSGALDIIGIWNVEKTSGEVSQLYNAGNAIQYPYPVIYSIVMALGSFTYTGYAVGIIKSLLISLESGIYRFTGYNVKIFNNKWRNQTKNTSTWTNQVKD
jgi:hypothetical protein